jgi:DNA-binding XRE family transcriptional regulator
LEGFFTLKVEKMGQLAHMTCMLTPKQSKAARALLGWTQTDLAEAAGVKIASVKDFESERHDISSKGLTALIRAFQKAGLVLFWDGEGGGPGVRIKEPEQP